MKRYFPVFFVFLVCVAIVSFTIENAMGAAPKPPKKKSKKVYISVHSKYIHQISLNYKGYYIINKSWSDRAGTWRQGASEFFKCNQDIREGESGRFFIGWFNNTQTESYQKEKTFTFKVKQQSWTYGPTGSQMKVSVRWAPEYGTWFFSVVDK